jgi:hypothetical protein
MTDTLREIERGYEAKFKLDEELRFKVRSRSNKLFGLWAAELLGKSGSDAEAYARALVRRDLDRPGTSIVMDTVRADLGAAGRLADDSMVEDAYSRCAAEAAQQVLNDYPTPLDRDHVQVGG